MTIDCIWQLKQAIYQELDADFELKSLVSGVYSHVPQNTSFPYIKFNLIQGEDWPILGKTGVDATISLSAYSCNRGAKKTLNILSHIKHILNGKILTMPDCTMTNMNYTSSHVFQLNDGITWQGNIGFNVKIVNSN